MVDYLQKFNTLYFDFFGEEFSPLLERYVLFSEGESGRIVRYFEGGNIYPESSFEDLIKLQEDINKALHNITSFKNIFVGGHCLKIVDLLDSMRLRLQTLSKASKYLRSTLITSGYESGEITHIINQNETLSDIGNKLLGDDTYGIDIAIHNKLSEEGYSLKGGELLRVVLPSQTTIKFVRDVVGGLQDDNIYGIDIAKEFVFEGDDLVVLSPQQTFKQSSLILLDLKKGNNPEFRDNGVRKDFVGGNESSLLFPILYKDIIRTFDNDDTVLYIQLDNIKIEEGELILDLTIVSRRNEVINGQIKI